MERVEIHQHDNIDGGYRVEKKLGEGSFGQVFKVTDRQGRVEALKILKMWSISPDEREKVMQRFDMEYATGKIESPYLVHSIDKGSHRGNPFIVMEYCDGGTLVTALNEQKTTIEQSMTEVLCGLKSLHEAGKVHRDLKPENVLTRKDGTAVLTDFGISGDQNHRLTRRGIFGTPKEIMGTFIYMPPEQVKPPSGNATVRPTTDIFSFGVMLYQLLTGELPFGKLNNMDDMERYCENGLTGRWNRSRLQQHPQAATWMPIVEGCLQPNFTRRLQTVDEVLRMMPKVKQSPMASQKTKQEEKWQPGQWRLRVMQGEDAGRCYELDWRRTANHILCVGRKSSIGNNHIAITETYSAYISRYHCTLEYDKGEDRWYVWDGQWVESENVWRPSLNGTYVGSQQATMDEPVAVKRGDIITMGDVTLRVE